MTNTEKINTPLHRGPLSKRMIQGAIVGLFIMSAFLISAGQGKPEWGNWWAIRPLVVLTFAGAMGGIVYYYMDEIRSKGGWNRFFADFITFIICLFGLWIGSVLGLSGTYWN